MSLSRVSLLVALSFLGACAKKRAPAKKVEPPAPVLASVERKPGRVPADLQWLAFGGGSDPLSNQVSLAQDLTLARGSFAGSGLMLFASGPGAQVAIMREASAQSVRSALSRILGPAGGEHIRYEPTKLQVDAPATRELVLDALRGALATQGDPLVILAASHGDHGEVARKNALALWGGWGVSVEDVAELLDREESTRPTRLVVTACYGGGFAELAFVGADPQRGPRAPTHCGLFAAPWDDESSGCDPDADRARQESFTIHFLSALRGEDRRGRARKEIDLDHDGKVSLLEAHAWARIHARSFDVPTTTSERYLREYAPANETGRAKDGEEQSVIAALSAELELDDERLAKAKLRELERILDDAADQLEDAQAGSDDAYTALRIALLERWPLLEHSWDPDAEALIEREGAAILQLLSESELAQQYEALQRELDDAGSTYDSVRIARARVQRLVHAFETTRLAAALEKRGGAHWQHYQALRACERFTPPMR